MMHSFSLKSEKRRIIILLFLIILLGAGLRLFNLGKFDFWFDEAITVIQAQNINAVNFLEGNTPPLYVYLLSFWGSCFDSEPWFRLPSVIFGCLSIFMIFILGRSLFGENTALVSSFLLAVSPLHIYYSQEARMYSLIVLMNLLAVYALVESFRHNRWLWWILYGVFSALNIYTHYIGVFTWLAQVIFFLFIMGRLERRIIKKWCIVNLLILLSFLPWFFFVIGAVKKAEVLIAGGNLSHWGPAVSLASLFMTIKNFSIGYHAYPVIYIPVTGIYIFFLVRGIMELRKDKKRELGLCLSCFALPILSVFLVSLSFKRIYIDRFFLGNSVFYLLLVSAGLSAIKAKRLIPLLLTVVIASSLSLRNYYLNILPPPAQAHTWVQKKKEHKAATTYILDKFREGDRIFHACHNTTFPFMYYTNRMGKGGVKLGKRNISLAFSDEINDMKAFEFDLYSYPHERPVSVAFGSPERFWLIYSFWVFDRIGLDSPQIIELVRHLDKDYSVIESREFDGISVFLYARRHS